MKIKVKKLITNLLKLGVSVGALWFVLLQVPLKDILNVLFTSNPLYLSIALFFLTISYLLSAFRQNLSFRVTGAHLSEMLNLKVFWLGLFYNLFLPGGVGGDGYKVYLINKYRKNGIKHNIGAMLVNRIAGLVAIGVITVGLYYLSGINFLYGNFAWIALPLVFGLYFVVMKYFFKSFVKIQGGLLWWSIALQLMQLISAAFILKAFHQNSDIFDYLFLFFVSAVATALPITIGGFGAREMVFLLGAKHLYLHNEIAVSLSVTFTILSAFLSLGGIYWVFLPPFRKEAKRSKTDPPNTEGQLDASKI